MCGRHFTLGAMLLAGAFWPAVAGAGEEAPDFAAVRRAVRTKARSRRPQQRIEAIRQLEAYHRPESADLVLEIAVGSSHPEVRQAAGDALAAMVQSPEVAGGLMEKLRRQPSRLDPQAAGTVIEVLLTAESAEVQGKLTELLDQHVARSPDGPLVLSLVATSLVARGDAQAVDSLVRLTGLEYFAQNFGFRRGLVQALVAVRRPESVETLIDLLPRLQGEERADIVNYLSALSGQRHGLDAAAWDRWWQERKAGFQFPPQLPPIPRAAAAGGPVEYYGLPIYALRMVFVIDISGSMEGARLAAAKRELIQVIDGLRPEAWFGIVAFSSRAAPWQPRLVPAGPEQKRAAARFVAGLRAGGMTASFDALETAFRWDTEAIYLVSDGAPTAGRIVDPARIIAFVSGANRFRRVSIYTIGVLPGPPTSPLSQFMQALADGNFGVYRQVDQ